MCSDLFLRLTDFFRSLVGRRRGRRWNSKKERCLNTHQYAHKQQKAHTHQPDQPSEWKKKGNNMRRMSHHMTLIYYQCRKCLIEPSDLRNGLRHYERSMVIAWENVHFRDIMEPITTDGDGERVCVCEGCEKGWVQRARESTGSRRRAIESVSRKIVVWSIKNNRFCLHTSVRHLKVAHVLFTNPLQPSPSVHKKQAAILFRLFALLSFFYSLSSALRLSIHRFASIRCAVSKVAI